MSDFFTVFDLGSSKIVALLAQEVPKGFEVFETVEAPAHGFRNGQVKNFYYAVETLKKIAARIEKNRRLRLDGTFVHIASPALRASYKTFHHISTGIHTIDKKSCALLLGKAEVFMDKYKEEKNETIVSAAPLHYILDGARTLKDPVGEKAHKLSLDACFFTLPNRLVNDLYRCFERAHLSIAALIPAPYGAGIFLRSQHPSASIVIDFGATTTSVGLFYKEVLAFAKTIPLGGHTLHALSVSATNASSNPDALQGHISNLVDACKEACVQSPFYRLIDGPLAITGQACRLSGLLETLVERFGRDVLFAQQPPLRDNLVFTDANIHAYAPCIGSLENARVILEMNEKEIQRASLTRPPFAKQALQWMKKNF